MPYTQELGEAHGSPGGLGGRSREVRIGAQGVGAVSVHPRPVWFPACLFRPGWDNQSLEQKGILDKSFAVTNDVRCYSSPSDGQQSLAFYPLIGW